MCVKTLISFGANIRSTDLSQHTPLQVCSNTKIIDLLEAVEASHIKPDTADESCEVYKRKETLMEYIRRRGEPNICDELEEATNQILSLSLSHSLVLTDSEAAAITFQKREIARFRKTNPHIPRVLRKGDRILCLDGGGMKGLAQIEVLSQLEEATGQKITDLFDWIVGTSTGAIIALAMVYGELFASELLPFLHYSSSPYSIKAPPLPPLQLLPFLYYSSSPSSITAPPLPLLQLLPFLYYSSSPSSITAPPLPLLQLLPFLLHYLPSYRCSVLCVCECVLVGLIFSLQSASAKDPPRSKKAIFPA